MSALNPNPHPTTMATTPPPFTDELILPLSLIEEEVPPTTEEVSPKPEKTRFSLRYLGKKMPYYGRQNLCRSTIPQNPLPHPPPQTLKPPNPRRITSTTARRRSPPSTPPTCPIPLCTAMIATGTDPPSPRRAPDISSARAPAAAHPSVG